jgi:hypothetical protein
LSSYLDRSIILSGAGFIGYRDVVRFGLGCNIKSWSQWMDPESNLEDYDRGMYIYDVGLYVSADIMRRSEYTLSAAAGYAYLNITDRGDTPPYLTGYYPDEYRRYGLNICFATAAKPWMDDFFEIDIPAIAVTVDYDVEDCVTKWPWIDDKSPQHSGIELAVLQIMFLRVGYIDDRTGNTLIQEPTWGGGLGITYKRFAARFDFSRSPDYLDTSEVVRRFGLTLGAKL